MGQAPIEWMDSPIETKERKILTRDQLGVPGLRMIGHHSTAHAISALDLHYHKDCFELTYVVQGNVRFSVDGRMYPLSGGDLFITLPDEVHDTGSAPMSLHQMYWFQINLNHPDGFLFMAEPAVQLLREHLYQLPARVIKMDADQATSIMSDAFQYFRSGTELGQIQGAQLLGLFLLQAVERADLTSFRITPDIGRTMDYILEHIQDELPMEELAQVALLSVSRFKQKFKLEIGTSPRNFINFHKVEAAKRLLLEGRSVTDVAMELNFSSSNYFSSVFRRYTSFSPPSIWSIWPAPTAFPLTTRGTGTHQKMRMIRRLKKDPPQRREIHRDRPIARFPRRKVRTMYVPNFVLRRLQYLGLQC